MAKICREVEVAFEYSVPEPGSDVNFQPSALASYVEEYCVSDKSAEDTTAELNTLVAGFCYGDARPLKSAETYSCASTNEYPAKTPWLKKMARALDEMLGNI